MEEGVNSHICCMFFFLCGREASSGPLSTRHFNISKTASDLIVLFFPMSTALMNHDTLLGRSSQRVQLEDIESLGGGGLVRVAVARKYRGLASNLLELSL